MHHGVDPATCFYIIQPSDDYLELPKEILIEVLNRLSMRINCHTLDSIHDEGTRDMRLVLADIRTAEQKLSV